MSMPRAETEGSVPAIMAPAPARGGGFMRSRVGLVGLGVLLVMLVACLGTLPWTMGDAGGGGGEQTGAERGVPRYAAGSASQGRLPPWWVEPTADQRLRLNALVPEDAARRVALEHGVSEAEAREAMDGPVAEGMEEHHPRFWLGTDVLGRSLLVRVLAGGGISLAIGVCAAGISVFIGTLYGAIAGWMGGRVDAVMMRIVDVLYGLPYVLLVVLLAVASAAVVDRWQSRAGAREAWVERSAEDLRDRLGVVMEEPIADADGLVAWGREAWRSVRGEDPGSEKVAGVIAGSGTAGEAVRRLAEAIKPARALSGGARIGIDLVTLLVAIGGVSWLTMARVIRGQVLSLKARPFVEAARALGASPGRVFGRHLLPNLLGPITVYATLTVPQAILQESFLSFLGIGVMPPLPSWGNLAAEALGELNPYQSHWWLLVFPCVLLGVTLLALNFVGEGLREALDPRAGRRV